MVYIHFGPWSLRS